MSSDVNLKFLIFAALILLVGHVIRAVRWRLILLQDDIKIGNIRPIAALSVGYFFNAILPLRLGEIIRSALLAYTARTRFSSVFATVFFERTIDLFAVAIIGFIVLVGYGNLQFVYESVGILAIIIAVAIAVQKTHCAKKLIWNFAALFNERAKSAILHFGYLTTYFLTSSVILKNYRFWLLTVLMWSTYMTSLGLLAHAFSDNIDSVFLDIYVTAIDLKTLSSLSGRKIWLLVYLMAPLVVVVTFVSITGFNVFTRFRDMLREMTKVEQLDASRSLTPRANFWSEEQYAAFLDRRFSGSLGLVSSFEERGIDGVRLYRLFHGGSGAITALIEADGTLRVRKFATGENGKKLLTQRDWLVHNAAALPLVRVFETAYSKTDACYDMEYLAGSIDFYEGIHVEPTISSIKILNKIITAVNDFHCETEATPASDDVVEEYIAKKVVANFTLIKSEFADIISLGRITVNGHKFDCRMLEIFSNPSFLMRNFTERRQAVIHGDLTIENIMLDPKYTDHKRKWFLIDPNPVNGFQTPLIDFAKLMQSLHMGYEALRKNPEANFNDGSLTVGIHRSYQYDTIYNSAINSFETLFGQEGLKQIYMHEWVNYLRLIPYQLRYSRTAGLAFFGCLCLLLIDFDRKYPGEIQC